MNFTICQNSTKSAQPHQKNLTHQVDKKQNKTNKPANKSQTFGQQFMF